MAETDQEKQAGTVYEVGYLLLPSIAEEKLAETVNSIKTVISKAGGIEIAGEDPFMQELAYTMNKTVGASRYVVNEAYLGWLKFELASEAIKSVQEEIEKMPEVLRFLLIKAPRETSFTFADAKKALEEDAAQAEAGEVAEDETPVAKEEQVVE